MELPPFFWSPAASSPGAVPVALAMAVLSLAYSLLLRSKLKLPRGSGDSKKFPPWSPGGVRHHVRLRASGTDPAWRLAVAERLRSRVFRIPVPVCPPRRLHMVAVGEPAALRAVLTCPATTKPERIYRHFRNLTGGAPGVGNLDGPRWRAKRKAIAPAFSSHHVRRMTRVALERTDEWIETALSTEVEGGASFDVSEEMVGIVLSSLTETAFGYEMSEDEKEMFGRELELALVEFTSKAPVMPLRAFFGWAIPSRRRALIAVERLNVLVRRIMDQHRAGKGPTEEGTLIQLIMESKEAFPTESEKAAQLLGLLFAGRDTTAYTISFILMELARHPEEQAKLRESLSESAPENWTSSERLQRVVKEGMRLRPVANSLRETGREILTSRDEVLPAGSICLLDFLMLHRNPNVFADPHSFRPSRWERPSREMLDSFRPFSLGKHNCVGQSLARAEIFGIVARICSEYELSMEEEGRVEQCATTRLVGARLRARKV